MPATGVAAIIVLTRSTVAGTPPRVEAPSTLGSMASATAAAP